MCWQAGAYGRRTGRVAANTDSHDELARRIGGLLKTAVPEFRVWSETVYRFADGNWLKPDVSVSWPEQRVEDDYKQGAPMLAVEVASYGNTPHERKRILYLAHGAAEVWVIYPQTRSMLVARNALSLHVEPDVDYHCELISVTVTPEFRTLVRF